MKHNEKSSKFLTVRLPVEMRKSDLFWLVAAAFHYPRHQKWVKGGEFHPTLEALHWEGMGGDDSRWLDRQGPDTVLATFRAADEDDLEGKEVTPFEVKVTYESIMRALESPNTPIRVAQAVARGERHPMVGDAVLQVMAYGHVVWPFDHDHDPW
jgi:hypothetical protein